MSEIILPTPGDIVEALERAGGRLTFNQLQSKFRGFPTLLKRVTLMEQDREKKKICFNDDWQSKDDLVIILVTKK